MNVLHHVTQTPHPDANPRQTIASFLGALYDSTDLLEIRVIETWTGEFGKKVSRPMHRSWRTPREILEHLPELWRLNKIGNVFFGVNPRTGKGGTKSDVHHCRSVWVDLDHVTPSEAARRWNRIEMPPTIVVNSGHGVHAYWALATPIVVTDRDALLAVESMVKAFAAAMGGDATHDCARLLRLPGTWNVKDRRNGVLPVPCTLVSVDAKRVYPCAAFAAYEAVYPHEASPPRNIAGSERGVRGTDKVALSGATIGRSRDHRRIQGVIRYLDREVPDRSRRDLSALILLIQAGLSQPEIYSLVMNHSKFQEAGDEYFERTLNAALRMLGQ